MLTILLSSNSCKKYLELAPENSTYDEIFWKDANNIPSAVAGGYNLLREAFRLDRSYFIFGDLAASNFTVGSDYWNYKEITKAGNFNFKYVPYLESSLLDWTRFYRVINQCNLIIEKTPLIPNSDFYDGEAEKMDYIAKARFLRAYTYFYMQRIWGDVILVKESFKDPQNIPPLARASQDETLRFCIDDLLFVIDNVDADGSKTMASVGAAKALLAHVYAWQHDYINAEIMANEVIISGTYSLEAIDDYTEIWKGDSEEVIWEIPMLYSENGNEFTREFFNIFLVDPYISGKTSSSAWKVDNTIVTDYFDEPEDRLESVVDNDNYLTKYSNVVQYDANNNEIYAVSNNLVLLRLADLYLLRAEAYSKNNKDGLALGDLNKIRVRAGLSAISTTGDDLFLEIFRERRRELIGEGHAQFDLIRMGMLTLLDEFNVVYSSDRINNQGFYWPLYMRVLLPQNELLTQNPWWINN